MLGARRAVYIPFTTAIPQKAVLDIDNCVFCGKCEKACPTDAIDFAQEPTTGARRGRGRRARDRVPDDPDARPSRSTTAACPNVISGLDMERLLAPNGPYGRVLRPSDGKIPDSVAYVQCAGSRDETLGVPYCSRVCCMYAIKQAMLLSGALPLADITIYYMDIRAFGKGYEQFYQTRKSMGIEFVKAKVARIEEQPGGDLRVRESSASRATARWSRSITTSSSSRWAWHPVMTRAGSSGSTLTRTGSWHRPIRSSTRPGRASRASSPRVPQCHPKDIVDTVVEASAAAAQVAAFLGPLASPKVQLPPAIVEVREMGREELAMAGALAEAHHG